MGERLRIHPVTPQRRFVERASRTLADHGVVILPTDTTYAFTARPGSKAALEKISRIKQFDPERKLFSLIVPDLSDVARYALVTNHSYRILRRFLPGPYTFILPASREVPRILLSKRKTIGLRVPDHTVCREVARAAGGGLLATSLRLPGDEYPLMDPDEIDARLLRRVDLFLDCDWGGIEPSTLVDLSGEEGPQLVREGAGDIAAFKD
ncbi:MAG: L-threonylcarbamoyladenylate synthase [Acidobacteriota bacterium]|nr:L-threonylcarbamoyladenylate synthase [Acidobacteriota bacterium]MDQ7087861.1 L-threonylcarbamoyladenylate synthase [Acidobacteriota bacterium]